MQLENLFNKYIDEARYTTKVREATLKGYRQSFTILKSLIPGIDINTLLPETMSEFFRLLQERTRYVGEGIPKHGVKKSTIASHWNKLNSFFKWLQVKGYINQSPFAGLKYPSVSYEDKKFLTRKQIDSILSANYRKPARSQLVQKRNLVIFHLLLFCGLRREELLSLQVSDIDLDRNVLKVRSEVSKVSRSRYIPLHSSVIYHLKQYLKERQKLQTPFLIVSSMRDDKLSRDGFIHLMTRWNTISGIRFHAHQFRHTFAVNYLKASNDVVKLRQLMGHRDIKMTLVYLRCIPTDEMRSDINQLSLERLI